MTNDFIPADVVLEKQILGIVLSQGAAALVDLERVIEPADFFTLEHGQIYGALLSMFHDGTPIELAAVATEFRRRGIMATIGQEKSDAGGAEYLAELVGEYGFDTYNLRYYADQLRDKSRLRGLISMGAKMSADAKAVKADAGDLVERFQQELYVLSRLDGGAGAVVSAGDAVAESITQADLIAAGQSSPGLMTGFDGIDRAVGGFQPGDLVTVGAATSVGKTALALCIGKNIAQAGGAVLFVSAEMTRLSIGNRLLAIMSNVYASQLRTGNLNQYELEARAAADAEIKKWHFSIYDRPATVAEIATRARLLSAHWRRSVSLVVVDYLQLMRPSGGDTRAQEVSGIAWGLKLLGVELGCAVLMLSQLNRAGVRGADDDRPPMLYDLKESGDVENHSNTVILLHRPSNPVPDTAGAVPIWCKIAKGRDAMVTPWPAQAGRQAIPGSITLRFRPELTKFE
jgi:replicative DNA helicase